jgi:hypothetical protein
MKKFSVILIVSVIAMAMAFAGISGKASIELGYNLDNGDYGFTNAIKFTVDKINLASGEGSAKGEGAIYAEIAGSFSLDVAKKSDQTANISNADQAVGLTAKITKANVVGENWSVSILGPDKPFDFAVSALDKTGTSATTKKVAPIAMGSGFAFTYGDFAGAFGLNGNTKTPAHTVYAWAGTKALEVADGVKLGADVVLNLVDAQTLVGGSLKLDYASDAFKAVAAADASIQMETGVANVLVYDASLKAVVSLATINAYYNSDKLLSAGVTADLNEFEVPATVTVKMIDILAAKKLGVSAKATLDALVLEPYFDYNLSTSAWDAGVDATYTAENYEITAGVEYDSASSLPMYIEITTGAIINGATLGFAYDCDFVAATKVLGAPTLSATIAF